MCVVCGCGQSRRATVARPREVAADLHYGANAAGQSVPGLSTPRSIRLEARLLGENQRHADQNRALFRQLGVRAFNLVSSPGSGKTSLLCATIAALRGREPGLPVAVIEGDQQTSHDAERIRQAGAPAVQINTGKGCHLDARMVAEAAARLPLASDTAGPLLFIENVGNLVCPAMWDLGEAAKLVILSVTEGDDKPLKYPDMFAAASLMVINKLDLLPHVDFDLGRCIDLARRVNPDIEVLLLSARTGVGLDAWVDWLLQAAVPTPDDAPAASFAESPATTAPA